MKAGQNLKYMKSFFMAHKITPSWKEMFSTSEQKNNKAARNLKRTKLKRK